MLDALKLLKKYADSDDRTRFYDTVGAAPMDGVVRRDRRETAVDDQGKVERPPTSCASWWHCGTRSAAMRSTVEAKVGL